MTALEDDIDEKKERIEQVVRKLVGRQETECQWRWKMEPIWHGPFLPPCEAPEEMCPSVELQRPERSRLSRYHLKATR